MKIKIMADTAIKGVPVYIGQIVDVDDSEGRILILYKLAEPYTDPVCTLPEKCNQNEEADIPVSSRPKKRR